MSSILKDITERTLICVETNAFAKWIEQNMPEIFEDGLSIRLITQKYSNQKLPKTTKCFAEITNFNDFHTIICTIGVAPKLATHCNFSNIFILNAETISELDSWMIIGMLADLDTKVFLSGNINSKNKVWGISSLSSNKKDGCISMFERLCNFPNVKADLSTLNVYEHSNVLIEI